MSQTSQTLWILAPTEVMAIGFAQHRPKEYAFKTKGEAVDLQQELHGKRGMRWPVWEMTFSVEIKRVG
jgi:hypothetical protein